MKGFVDDIDRLTVENKDFRRVLYTGKHLQLVLMALRPGEEIGEEVHEDGDQFFRFEKGKGQVVTAKVKGGASGKLYGKVTGKEVAELLTALTGTEIDKKKVELPSAIKEFGSYDASVRLYAGVVAPFKLKVEEL